MQNANLATTNNFGILVGGNYSINPDGTMGWSSALALVAAMNASNYGGFGDWALPLADPSCPSGSFCATSQLGHLWSVSLGNPQGGPMTSVGPFLNVATGGSLYWSGVPNDTTETGAWYFSAANGGQWSYANGDYVADVWVVRPAAPSDLLLKLLTEVTGIAPSGLETKATSALKDLEAACTTLTNFVSQVQSQNGKKISPTLAGQLSAEAQAIENAIGCQLN